ncbi:MAG TPA: hypothetical protein PKL73_08065 [Polyangiaceae bacterium]|nr:hypothetical protein [Polyangiaceae bacterium]HNZ24410.1 hypothetical protein [Polyangiaceae bacterium]HOD22474.1 hypothetical protein [Polyangiaceae bacterium]HOE49218.1 hypothetical protein [Polyangiaceae bacterium]HOH03549.1 hypothetical protein [Polyangiaceae bacterium]
MSYQGLLYCILISTLGGCASQRISDPRSAAEAYAQAASRGDGDMIYDMLDEQAQRSMTRAEVRKLVANQREELAEQAKAIRSPQARVRSTATIRFADGEDAILDLSENGQFLIVSADALPAGARTPVQALDQLRHVLARRSYPGLLRVLSTSTRSAMENDLRSLVEGLENPEELDVQQSGETATVRIPGGHWIVLRREGATWRIDNID